MNFYFPNRRLDYFYQKKPHNVTQTERFSNFAHNHHYTDVHFHYPLTVIDAAN